ncbi:N-acetylmuramoyl-L-alanine amidase [Oceanicaulis alexandrii]|uniref:N-acetylmuramoyl-L-alanine amidase n=1 Tax=Oceanicaulis alexandrii TaxID=153233 RepID=UPI002357D1BA|nr:N-acetylmuramoyl-L-alanine amidase [Oceanicaulis alexandrii]
MAVITRPSPNFNDRRLPPSMLVLHYTGMETGDAAIERLCDPEFSVSAHYVVEEDGRVFQLVSEDKRAWHAGKGVWRGCSDINSASIGVEIVNGGHDFGLPDYPEAQIEAVLALCQGILARHPIKACDVIGHSDLAPDRKQDPGEKFPWKRFAEAGVGLWPQAVPSVLPPCAPGDEGEAVTALRQALCDIGYGAEPTGAYDQALKAVVLAFQRRFRSQALTGFADEETCALIEGLRRQVTSVIPKG